MKLNLSIVVVMYCLSNLKWLKCSATFVDKCLAQSKSQKNDGILKVTDLDQQQTVDVNDSNWILDCLKNSKRFCDLFYIFYKNEIVLYPNQSLDPKRMKELKEYAEYCGVVQRPESSALEEPIMSRPTRSFLNKLLQNKDDDLDLDFLLPNTEHHQQKYKSEQKMYEFFGTRGKKDNAHF